MSPTPCRIAPKAAHGNAAAFSLRRHPRLGSEIIFKFLATALFLLDNLRLRGAASQS